RSGLNTAGRTSRDFLQQLVVPRHGDLLRKILLGVAPAALAHLLAQQGIAIDFQDGVGEILRAAWPDTDAALSSFDERINAAAGIGACEQWTAAGHDFVNFRWERFICRAVFV